MDASRASSPTTRPSAFTILETLVSFAVLAILLVLMAAMISRTTSIWGYTRGQAEQFREARDAFDTITRRLSEATLNTYFDYEDAGGNPRTAATSTSFVPKKYGRQSELRFLSGPDVHGESHAVFFQSPTGKNGDVAGAGGGRLLNTLGYFLEYGDDRKFLPEFLEARRRLRLMEFCEPSEELSVYRFTSGNATPADRAGREWFTARLDSPNPPVQIVAENIVALVLLPMLPATDQLAGNYDSASLAPEYLYDSTMRRADANLNPRNQLPPVMQVTMVAIDEASASRLGESGYSELLAAVASRFSEASEYDSDMATLQDELTRLGVTFRVFTSNVILKNAKWSREQKG